MAVPKTGDSAMVVTFFILIQVLLNSKINQINCLTYGFFMEFIEISNKIPRFDLKSGNFIIFTGISQYVNIYFTVRYLSKPWH